MGREENFAFCGMVGADAELPFPVRTSPIIIAELVHRKLNVCAGGIAQMKKRVPHIRTQESSASGTAERNTPSLGRSVWSSISKRSCSYFLMTTSSSFRKDLTSK